LGHRKVLCRGQLNPFELWQKMEKDLHTASTSDSVPSMWDHALLHVICVGTVCTAVSLLPASGREGGAGERRKERGES